VVELIAVWPPVSSTARTCRVLSAVRVVPPMASVLEEKS
jgi:hypothetical protein